MDDRFDWSTSKIIEKEYYPEDMLEHARYADFLTRFLVSQGFDKSREVGEQEKNYVLNLNSAWGSGKTYFLRRWAEDLKAHYPVVYVDAWKKDYSDDPLMTVVSAIISCLSAQAGKDQDSVIKSKLPRKILGLLKAAAPGAASAFGKRYFGIDPVALMTAKDDEELGHFNDSEGNPVQDENGNALDMGAAASQAVKYLIDEHEAKTEAIESLKTAVKQWVGAVVGLKKVSLPAFIFIDELDRCRPSYAVEMLETIKHIFDIEGVVFVVATDTEQLQHAVKAVYGEGFDARVYLSRFFNSRFSLKEPKLNKLLNVHCESHKLSSDYLDDKCIVTFPLREDGNRVLENIAELVSVFGHTPRTAIQVAERVIATISNMPMHTNVDILLLTFLLSLKEKDHELYNEVVTGSFDRREEGKTLSLIDYLDKQYLISSQERYLHFHLEPLLITENISDGRRYNIANPYPVDVYSISVYSYLSDIVMPQLEQSSNDINIWLVSNESEPEQKPLEKVSRRLIDYYYSKKNVSLYHRNPEVTAMWIEYLYLHYEYDFSSVSVEKYRELVDFASALDWLYLHEGSEVS